VIDAIEARVDLYMHNYAEAITLAKGLTLHSDVAVSINGSDAEHFGAERQASVSREISKMHEETVRGTLTELIEHFTANEPRGEIVIVVTGIDD
jgi:hypothetical protein